MPVAKTIRTASPTPTLSRAVTVPLTWTLAAVLVAATVYGLFADGYGETAARELLGATLRGQDVLTLLTVPALLASTLMARRGSLRAHLVSLGILLYVPYTYLMYVVVPYNDAFLLYVAAIGLGSYLFFDGLIRTNVHALRDTFVRVPRRGIGWFLIATGALFGAMWLMQNLTVIPGGVPDGLFVYDIPSTVHVLDLAFMLPAAMAAGVLLLRGHPAGAVLAAVMLIHMVTLGLALLFMDGGTAVAGSTINAGETLTWATIVLVSGGFLLALFRAWAQRPQAGSDRRCGAESLPNHGGCPGSSWSVPLSRRAGTSARICSIVGVGSVSGTRGGIPVIAAK